MVVVLKVLSSDAKEKGRVPLPSLVVILHLGDTLLAAVHAVLHHAQCVLDQPQAQLRILYLGDHRIVALAAALRHHPSVIGRLAQFVSTTSAIVVASALLGGVKGCQLQVLSAATDEVEFILYVLMCQLVFRCL